MGAKRSGIGGPNFKGFLVFFLGLGGPFSRGGKNKKTNVLENAPGV